MGPEKDIVNWWLNRGGFFTINSIKVSQNKEIDLIAIKLGDAIKVQHIEVSCSITPTGNLTLDKSDVQESVQKFIAKKFEDQEVIKKIRHIVEEFVGKKLSYEKVLVLGALSKTAREKTIAELQNKGIIVHRFEDVLLDVVANLDRQDYRIPAIRNLQIVKYLLLSDPDKLAKLIGKRNSNDALNQFTREEFINNLLRQEEFIKILQKESNEQIMINILKNSSMTKPEKFARIIDEEILSKRTKKRFSDAINVKDDLEENEARVKKEKPLSFFLEDKNQ